MRYRLQEQIPAFPDEWENLLEADDLIQLHTLIVNHYQRANPENGYRVLDNDTKKYDTITEFYPRG